MSNEIDFDDDDFEEEQQGTASTEQMTLHDLYAQLLLSEDIIITINSDDFDSLKAGITSVKAKENIKLKNKGMPTDNTTLRFTQLPCEECNAMEMRVQISLTKRRTFTIKKLEVAEGF